MTQLTYNTRLVFDSEEDENKIWEVLDAQRFVVNECSKIAFSIRKKLNIFTLHHSFYESFRKSREEIPAQIVVRSINEVLSNYKSIKTSKHKIDKPIEKKNLSIRLDKRIYSVTGDSIKLTTLRKRIAAKFDHYSKLDEMLSKYEFCDPLIFVKNNQIWISLTFKAPNIPINNTNSIGVDLGIRVFAATSEGNLYIDKKFNKEKRKIRYSKRQLQSKGTKSSKRHLKKLKHKEFNKNNNFTHNLANRIIKDTKCGIIVMEDLSKIKAKKTKYENKNRISQISLYNLRTILTYKAPLFGKVVETVSPAFTSQRDHRTGELDGKRMGRRYIGKDGIILDADINAAINIAIKSKHPVSIGNYLDGQGTVNCPIVSVCKEQATKI